MVNSELKEQLLDTIYDLMVAKGFTSPRGNLLMDVYIEVRCQSKPATQRLRVHCERSASVE